jgi:hypothetical protein
MKDEGAERQKRSSRIIEITGELNRLLPDVLAVTGIENERSLHAKFGSKNDIFLDIKHEVINSPEHFTSLWLQGFMRYLEKLGPTKKHSTYFKNFYLMKAHKVLREYVLLFLERTYLRNYDALSRVRPTPEEATIWIGQERASYGLLVTPKFKDGNWENDRSEIRHFRRKYWTVGHVLETGLVVPFKEGDVMKFYDVDQYLMFFKTSLVRLSGSPYEMGIAERYCRFVKESPVPEDVPLLIPEFRYGGIKRDHEYRLDFSVIDPFKLSKVGFELSPWSTHGQLTGLRGKTQAEINTIARGNFEKEMAKLKSYFREYGMVVLVFTDSELKDLDSVFEQIKKFLTPEEAPRQLRLSVLEDFMNFDV